MRSSYLLVLILSFLLVGCGGSTASNSTSAAANGSPKKETFNRVDEDLQKQIASIAEAAQGKVGVYAAVLEEGHELLSGDVRAPLRAPTTRPSGRSTPPERHSTAGPMTKCSPPRPPSSSGSTTAGRSPAGRACR